MGLVALPSFFYKDFETLDAAKRDITWKISFFDDHSPASYSQEEESAFLIFVILSLIFFLLYNCCIFRKKYIIGVF